MPDPKLLRNVPVLAGLRDDSLRQIAEEARMLEAQAGAWIMRAGGPADSLFIVGGGLLEVVDEGPPETLIRILRRGDVVGELALLGEGTRSVSVRALRDAALVELTRDAFENSHPHRTEFRARVDASDGIAARCQPRPSRHRQTFHRGSPSSVRGRGPGRRNGSGIGRSARSTWLGHALGRRQACGNREGGVHRRARRPAWRDCGRTRGPGCACARPMS